jgi:hypothetical protein
MLKEYADLLANVRQDVQYHSIRSLIQPNDPTVQEIADVLIQANDFVALAQDMISAFYLYTPEAGDFWNYPWEILEDKAGDCDCRSILLCSILRNFMPPEKVFCAFGYMDPKDKESGHMWVVVIEKNGNERVVEATAPSTKALTGKYEPLALFNDVYAFATEMGIKDFDLKPIPLGASIPSEPVPAST